MVEAGGRGELAFLTPSFGPAAKVGAVQKAESVGFQVRFLRHCFLNKLSLPLWRVPRKPNIRGLFAPDLLTGFVVSEALWLSLRPILSKAVDCPI